MQETELYLVVWIRNYIFWVTLYFFKKKFVKIIVTRFKEVKVNSDKNDQNVWIRGICSFPFSVQFDYAIRHCRPEPRTGQQRLSHNRLVMTFLPQWVVTVIELHFLMVVLALKVVSRCADLDFLWLSSTSYDHGKWDFANSRRLVSLQKDFHRGAFVFLCQRFFLCSSTQLFNVIFGHMYDFILQLPRLMLLTFGIRPLFYRPFRQFWLAPREWTVRAERGFASLKSMAPPT